MFSSLLDLGLLGDLLSSFDEDIPGSYYVTFSYAAVWVSVFLIGWCVRLYRLKRHTGKQINDVGPAKVKYLHLHSAFFNNKIMSTSRYESRCVDSDDDSDEDDSDDTESEEDDDDRDFINNDSESSYSEEDDPDKVYTRTRSHAPAKRSESQLILQRKALVRK